jgi:hypothetical protein
MEAQFTYRNDIDGTLGGDVVTMYLRPDKMAYGGGIGSYKKHTIGDTVEVYDFGGKTKIMKIIGFEDGRETYILESEDGKSRSYTPKKYIANLSGEFPYLEKEKMAKGGGVDVEYVLFDNYTYKKISEHKSLRSAKMAMDKMMDKGTYEEIGIKPKSDYEKLAKATFGQMAKGGRLFSKEDIEILGVPRSRITEKEWQSILRMAKYQNGATYILKDDKGFDVKPQTEYEWYVKDKYAQGGEIHKLQF